MANRGLADRLRSLPIRETAVALAVGAAGGAVAASVGLPLAWMLGPMLATAAASLFGVRSAVPMGLRAPLLVVLGVFVGSSFTPDSVDRIGEWPLSLIAVVALVPVFTGLAARYYARAAAFDRITALFAATPGGLTPMVLIGGAAGGDERRIALAQGLRVFIVVLLIPFVVDAAFSLPVPPEPVGPAPGGATAVEWIILLAGVGAGIVVARWVRLPVPQMTGAMFASAALHATGASTVLLPDAMLQATLLVVGASIGSRFSSFDRRALMATGGHAVLVALLMIGLSAAIAAGIAAGLGLDSLAVLLAFVPGGVAEMCLIAVALDVDPAFVAVHHLVRIFTIVLLAPLVGRATQRRPAKPG